MNYDIEYRMPIWIHTQLCRSCSVGHRAVPSLWGNWTAFAKMSTRISSAEHLPAKTCLNSPGSKSGERCGCWRHELMKSQANGEWSVHDQVVFGIEGNRRKTCIITFYTFYILLYWYVTMYICIYVYRYVYVELYIYVIYDISRRALVLLVAMTVVLHQLF